LSSTLCIFIFYLTGVRMGCIIKGKPLGGVYIGTTCRQQRVLLRYNNRFTCGQQLV